MFAWELVEHPPTAPFRCSCGESIRGPFVRTHLQTVEGEVYVCSECVRKIAALYAFVPVSAYEALDLQARESSARVAELSGELEAAQDELRSADVQSLRDRLEEFQAEAVVLRALVAQREVPSEPTAIGAAVAEAVAAFATAPKRERRKAA